MRSVVLRTCERLVFMLGRFGLAPVLMQYIYMLQNPAREKGSPDQALLSDSAELVMAKGFR